MQSHYPTHSLNQSSDDKMHDYRDALVAYDMGAYGDAQSIIESRILCGDSATRRASSSPSTSAALGGQAEADGDAELSTELMAAALLLLGNVHATRGEIGECDERYREAFEVLTVAFGEGHVGHATVLVNHSAVLIRRWQVLRHQQSPDQPTPALPKTLIYEALRMLQAAFAILEPILGVNRIILADCCHNIGVCLEALGHFVDALEYYMKSLKIRCRIQDASDLTQLCIATTTENVAMIYRQMQHKDNRSNPFLVKAEAMMENVLSIRKKLLGTQSGGVAEAHFNLALVNTDRGNTKAARLNLDKALQIRIELFGEQHELSRLAATLYTTLS